MLEITIQQRTHDLHQMIIHSENMPEFSSHGIFIHGIKDEQTHKFFLPYRNILVLEWHAIEEKK